MSDAVRLADKLAKFDDLWSPKIVARFNGHGVMVVKVKGELGEVRLGPCDLYVVPKGAGHRPVAEEEAHLLLIEPKGTPNTGDAATALVKDMI